MENVDDCPLLLTLVDDTRLPKRKRSTHCRGRVEECHYYKHVGTSMTVPGVWHENGFVIYMVGVYDMKNQAILQDAAYQSKIHEGHCSFFLIVFMIHFQALC